MRIPAAGSLFAWDCLEDSPSLATIGQFLKALPDGQLLESLRRHRGKGRNEYRVHGCWGVIVLTILLRHPHVETCLGEIVCGLRTQPVVGARPARLFEPDRHIGGNAGAAVQNPGESMPGNAKHPRGFGDAETQRVKAGVLD